MNINVFAARVNDDPVDIAERIRSRHLKMIPVVTHSNVLVGVVTAETAMELLSYELAEDLAESAVRARLRKVFLHRRVPLSECVYPGWFLMFS